MIRRFCAFILIIVLFTAILAGCSPMMQRYDTPHASKGVLDLRSWSFSNNGAVELGGEWAFFPGKLLPPERATREIDDYHILPESWDSKQNELGIKDGQGYATYRLLIIGFYHIGLYLHRRSERFTLHFGLLCLLVAIRMSVTGESYLVQTTGMPWDVKLKLEYTALALSAVAGFMYVHRLFPLETSKRVKKAVIAGGTLFSLFAMVTPSLIFSKKLLVYQAYVVAVGLYLVVVLVAALIRKRDGSSFALAGIAVVVFSVVNDVFIYNDWFFSTELVPFGLFFFILMQSFIISSRFSNALSRVEQVSSELRELNAHLEERIEERTEALKRTNETLAKANNELERMETSRRHLMSNISHDLRTPITLLQGYLEAMHDGVVKPEQQPKYIRMMLGKVDGLNRLIGDLFELSKLEAGHLHFDFVKISLAEWMERLSEQYEIDVNSAGVTFGSEYASFNNKEERTETKQIMLRLDLARMDQVMSNLIYNAVRHTEPGGKITLSFAFERTSGNVIIKVIDTGSGIEEEHLPYLFDRFYRKDISRNSAQGGSGLGLAIAKEIVEAHGGSIGVESVPGVGTSVWFSIPAREAA